MRLIGDHRDLSVLITENLSCMYLYISHAFHGICLGFFVRHTITITYTRDAQLQGWKRSGRGGCARGPGMSSKLDADRTKIYGAIERTNELKAYNVQTNDDHY